jgi:transposase
VGDVRRFAGRDHFASYNGTAPIEVSSGPKKIYRLSRRGNRRLHHAVHIVAVTQLRFRGTEGRAYFEPKPAEGKTAKRPCGPSIGASATSSTPASSKTPAETPPA